MTTKTKRATIYFDPDVHDALRLRSIEAGVSVSDLVDEAVRALLIEDAEDLAAMAALRDESTVPFENFVRDLRDLA
jgi:hypothetical protein